MDGQKSVWGDLTKFPGMSGPLQSSCEPELAELMKQVDLLMNKRENDWIHQMKTFEKKLKKKDEELKVQNIKLEQNAKEINKLKLEKEHLLKNQNHLVTEYEAYITTIKAEVANLKREYEALGKKIPQSCGGEKSQQEIKLQESQNINKIDPDEIQKLRVTNEGLQSICEMLEAENRELKLQVLEMSRRKPRLSTIDGPTTSIQSQRNDNKEELTARKHSRENQQMISSQTTKSSDGFATPQSLLMEDVAASFLEMLQSEQDEDLVSSEYSPTVSLFLKEEAERLKHFEQRINVHVEEFLQETNKTLSGIS